MKIILAIFFVFFMYSFSNAQCVCDGGCGGSGWITPDPEPCVKCGGSCFQSCDRCLGDGTELCKQCFCSGTVNDETCISCNGYGEWECGRCGGTGMEYCSLCGGEGYKEWKYPCEVCGRTGVVPCQ